MVTESTPPMSNQPGRDRDLQALLAAEAISQREVRDHTRNSFAALQSRLAGSRLDRWVRFFNMGYRQLPTDDTTDLANYALAVPPDRFNTDAARLVVELVGPTALDERRVLDVGCGRGGALALIRAQLRPRALVGVDLSDDNVAFVRRSGLPAVHADATALPFRPGSFDVVTNLESSQFYADPVGFFAGVRSALSSGGWFCYGDCFVTSQLDATRGILELCGLDLVSERDVSDNVLESRSSVGTRQSSTLGGAAPEDTFVGAPGANTYDWLAAGQLSYRLFRLVANRAPQVAAAREAANAAGLGTAASALVRITQGWVQP